MSAGGPSTAGSGEHACRKIVVVVDDEPGICETLAEVFQDEGYAVHCAPDGARALALFRSLDRRPCIVLLDLFMPVMDGNEVYEAMQADPALRDIAVVITTSDPSSAPAGVSIMKKPVSLKQLIETVHKFCRDSAHDCGG
jgi:CheY-like chemotaxis protein